MWHSSAQSFIFFSLRAGPALNYLSLRAGPPQWPQWRRRAMSLTFDLGHLNDLNVDVKEALKSSIFVVQKAAAPKTGVEFCQGSIGTIRSSLAMSCDAKWRHAMSPYFDQSEAQKLSHTKTDRQIQNQHTVRPYFTSTAYKKLIYHISSIQISFASWEYGFLKSLLEKPGLSETQTLACYQDTRQLVGYCIVRNSLLVLH